MSAKKLGFLLIAVLIICEIAIRINHAKTWSWIKEIS